MSREWKPGDVAMRTGADGSTVTSLVVRADRRRIDCWDNHGEADHWHHSNGGWNTIPDDPAFGTYRPLVVIDPDSPADCERLAQAWEAQKFADLGSVAMTLAAYRMQAALREFADPKPPKPDEPTGLGAVVEDADGQRFVRVCTLHPNRKATEWRAASASDVAGTNVEWDQIDAVRVLSEGVTE